MNGMIFAAGLGTRLRPLTNDIPKALVMLKGKPLLERIIIKMVDLGIKRIVVNVHHFSDKVVQFISSKNWKCDILISDESGDLLDTGGGLLYAKDLFEDGEDILIHNVDILSDCDIKSLIESHSNSNALATLLVRSSFEDRVLTVYNDKLTGWRNRYTGETKISNDDFYKSEFVGFTGVQIVSSEIFKYINEIGNFSIIDMYLRLARNKQIACRLDNESFFMDLGTIENIEKASAESNFL